MGALSFKQKLLNSKILFVICLFILFFFSINLTKEALNRQGLNKEVSALREQIGLLEQNNFDLLTKIENYKSSAFIEEEARTKLSLKKPGENIIIVPEGSVNDQNFLIPLVNLKNNKNQAETNPQKWLNYFFNNNLN